MPNQCLRCRTTEQLTRSHVPCKFVARHLFGSVKAAMRKRAIQLYWLCENCRREHLTLEQRIIQRHFLELAKELADLHKRFIGAKSE
jgi:hypothetical protein